MSRLPADDTSDESLMKLCREGEFAAYEALYTKYHEALFGFLCGIVRNREMAEDCLQGVFMRLLKKAHTYRYPSPFKPWLYRVAYNYALNELRKIKIRNNFLVGLFMSDNNRKYQEPEAVETAEDETAEEVRKAVDSLPEKQKAMLILSEYQGMTYDQIALTMGCGLGAVKYNMGIVYETLSVKLAHLRGK